MDRTIENASHGMLLSRWLSRVWSSMDHPDGKTGIAISIAGEHWVCLRGMSPKKALIVLLLFGSGAFVIGTALGLSLFDWTFDVPEDVRERVRNATRVGMVVVYASVVVGVVHTVFFRDARFWLMEPKPERRASGAEEEARREALRRRTSVDMKKNKSRGRG